MLAATDITRIRAVWGRLSRWEGGGSPSHLTIRQPASSALKASLGSGATFLCDPERQVLPVWEILSPHERGGIAYPATFVLDRDRTVRFRSLAHRGARVSMGCSSVRELGARRAGSGVRGGFRIAACLGRLITRRALARDGTERPRGLGLECRRRG